MRYPPVNPLTPLSANDALQGRVFGPRQTPGVPAGLLYPGGTTNFLRDDGTWAAPTAVASISQTEIDFGATGVSEASFVITDTAVSATSKLIGTVAYVAPTGKDLDELDMDQLDLKFAPGVGEFTLYATVLNECLAAGAFKINYQVGA